MINRWSVLRFAVMGLIGVALVAICASAYLLSQSDAVPEGLIAIGSTAVGALATLMVTSTRDESEQ